MCLRTVLTDEGLDKSEALSLAWDEVDDDDVIEVQAPKRKKRSSSGELEIEPVFLLAGLAVVGAWLFKNSRGIRPWQSVGVGQVRRGMSQPIRGRLPAPTAGAAMAAAQYRQPAPIAQRASGQVFRTTQPSNCGSREAGTIALVQRRQLLFVHARS